MAITIQDAPGNKESVNDEMIFVVYESVKANDEVTYPDYRYVADVYVNSVFAARLKARPDPAYRFGVFNVSTILRSYVEYLFKANYANFTENSTARVSYEMKFGEEYNDTTYLNLLVDGSPRLAFKSYAVRPFDDSSVIVTDKIASNIPNIQDASTNKVYTYRSTKWFLFNLYSDTYGGGTANPIVGLYDESGTLLDSQSITDSPVAENFLQVNAGPQALISNGHITQATLNAASYMLISSYETVRVVFLCEGKYTPVTLAWLNPYGVYDSYDFGLVSKKQIELTRKEFSKLNYIINSTGVMSYSADGVFYGSKKGFATDVKTTLKLTSHLLSEAEYTWLADLFISPDVYMYDSVRAKFHPVVVTENNYDFRNYKNSKLIPLEFNVQFSDNYNAQFK